MKDNKHHFAFYTSTLPDNLNPGSQHTLTDKDVVHRITDVVRLVKGDTMTLFTDTTIYDCNIEGHNKRTLLFLIQKKTAVTSLQPPLTLLLPILKKEALESALYTAVVMGISCVQLVTTEKSIKQNFKEHELERLRRIMIAAAEQSKQYALPRLNMPTSLTEALEAYSTYPLKLYADVAGTNIYEALNTSPNKKNTVICIGPEGDMTKVEKDLLVWHGFVFCRLTPTILKSEHALLLFAGMVRAF